MRDSEYLQGSGTASQLRKEMKIACALRGPQEILGKKHDQLRKTAVRV